MLGVALSGVLRFDRFRFDRLRFDRLRFGAGVCVLGDLCFVRSRFMCVCKLRSSCAYWPSGAGFAFQLGFENRLCASMAF